MKLLSMLVFLYVALSNSVVAEVAPVALTLPKTIVWQGQRLPFYVELRAQGTFSGTAAFDLPQLPGVIVVKVGNPVVSSLNIEGGNWFVQTHEFALFAQRPGILELPPFNVRFSAGEDFSGPAKEIRAQTPAYRIDVRRPPVGDEIAFLVTTEEFSVNETWQPQPAHAKAGTVFKRTIVQRAEQISGMALPPADVSAPEGIRVYVGTAETQDRMDRGEFVGERRDTLRYLFTKPGTFKLPVLTYHWWNPRTETLETQTLPAAVFEISAVSAEGALYSVVTGHFWLIVVLAAMGLGLWQRLRVKKWALRLLNAWNPPERRAARQLLRACRRHDADTAEFAWNAWRNLAKVTLDSESELQTAVLDLQRHLYGSQTSKSWRGDVLAQAFCKQLAAAKTLRSVSATDGLPALNP